MFEKHFTFLAPRISRATSDIYTVLLETWLRPVYV